MVLTRLLPEGRPVRLRETALMQKEGPLEDTLGEVRHRGLATKVLS